MKMLHIIASFAAVALSAIACFAETSKVDAPDPQPVAASPVANPAATVKGRHARFTVLTPQLIHMEWAENNQFENHASWIFLNRKLPVPTFTAKQENGTLTIDTGRLRLIYKGTTKATGFTSENLEVRRMLERKPVVWRPGTPSTGNLAGTTRTLDGAKGGEHLKEPIGPGLISRDGWTVIDDTGPLH